MNAIRNSPPCESTQILLGDASVSVRDLNAALLHRAGHPVAVETGRETLQEKNCNLLVIDYKLPGHPGLRLIVKMRAAHMTSPVIVTSITIDADELSRSSRFKLAATRKKTFTAEDLLEFAVAVLQIGGNAPVEVHPVALIESIERCLQVGPVTHAAAAIA